MNNQIVRPYTYKEMRFNEPGDNDIAIQANE